MSRRESIDSQHFDVAVIGAGIAGSMAALLCSRAGLRTVLLERHRFPRDKVCGCCVNGRALQILQRAGLESGLRKLLPTTTSSLTIQYRGRKLNMAMPQSYAVSRRAMDQWLVEEAVSSGCQFIDNVTATVQPLPSASDDWRSEVVDVPAADRPNEREIQLRFVNRQTANEKPPAGNEMTSADSRMFSKVILVCDGLGHPSLHLIPSFSAEAEAGSRIGLGAVFPRAAADDWIRQGEVLMAVTSNGYAGVVEIENNQLNLAAAVDAAYLKKSNSPLDALANIFQSAGTAIPQALANATIKGTVPLTRTARRIAGHRLLLLGDSTGYVEPFTGEGMAWALTAATAIAPLVVSAIRDDWSDAIIDRWQSTFPGIVVSQQKICRLLSSALRHPWLLPPILTTCQFFPSLTQQMVSRINRVPEALEFI